MVWLVEKSVTLPDGSTQKVLTPQVYVRVKEGDLDGTGALIGGKDVNLKLTGDLTNSGTIKANVAGCNVMEINAKNINNLGGRLSADSLSAKASEDINNVGGSFVAQSKLDVSAGRDLNVVTTTSTTTNTGANSFSNTGIDRVAGLYVKGSTGTLLASAGRDLNLTGAVISNAGTGDTKISAGNNLNLNTVTTASSQSLNWDANNHLRQSQSQDVGSQIGAAGSLSLTAGNDLNAKAASVSAGQALSVNAGNNVNITAGQASETFDEARKSKDKGVLSSTTTITQIKSASTTALGSTFEGNSVNVSAGKDLSVNGSNVLADQNVNLAAGGNVNITAAQNTESQSSFRQETKSGLMSSGGIGFTVGSRMQSVDQGQTQTTAAGSTVGSTGGNVTINAGKTYTQTGSDVLTPAGDIAITAKAVDINEARETGSQSTEQKFKQSGVSVGLTGGMIDTLQATTQAVQGAANSTSNRNKVLNALVLWGKGADFYEQGKAVQSVYDKNGVLGSEGKTSAAAASGIKVSISAGSSSSQSNSNTTYDSSAGSTVKAGGNVSIKATEGDLTVQGSNVQAEKDLALSAAKNVNILASADTEENRSTNKSSSTSVGVSFGVGAGSAGLSLDVAASRGKGQANSDSTTYNNSHVSAGNKVSISSGADTNVKGGNITGQQVTANVGGNLNVESLQDKATSNASQSTTGVAVSIPIGAGTGSASISQSKQRSDSNYQSTGEQSGISAGDGGFQINVKNNTDLKGAVIASNASADKNSLSTGSLTTSDLNNTMSASASSSGTTVGTNMLSGKYELGKAVVGNLLNNGSAGQSDASTTKTAISAAQVTVNGKTTDTSKDQLTDSNGKAVSTDTANASRTLVKADVAGLQKTAQDQQAGNNLLFKAATAFTDEAYRTMYKAGAQMYKVPPGCSDKSCAVPLSEQEAMALKTSQDGKVHLSNNGIFNDLDGAVKYAQQHGGTMNVDGSKDYSNKSENQYIIFAPQANNVLSELIIAGVQKSGATPYVGLTNAEQKTADVIQKTTQQGNGLVIDSHSRGTLTTTNAEQALVNQGGIKDAAGNTVIPTIQMNNYGGAQNNVTGNQTLQQLTGNKDAQINSTVHQNDLIGSVVGGNQATTTYTSTAADGTKTTVTGISDGKSPVGNAVNIMTGTVTPHNCYGTAGKECDTQWDSIPKSNSLRLTNPDYKTPVVIPQYQLVDKLAPQIQQRSNEQMNQLLQPMPTTTTPATPSPQSSEKLETLKNFKQER
jgi:filamentous hemagglutinin